MLNERILRTYLEIMDEMGWPNVYAIPLEQFAMLEGDDVSDVYEFSGVGYPVVAFDHRQKGKVLRNSIYHGLGHQLFPSKKHWWIYLYAAIMAGGGWDHQSKPLYGHTEADMPSRDELLRLSRLSARRYNVKRTNH